MRISLSWLKDFIDLSDLTPEKIAESLTLAGLEVDAIEPIEPSFQGLLLGKFFLLPLIRMQNACKWHK